VKIKDRVILLARQITKGSKKMEIERQVASKS